jgi:hypothetical protein
VSHLLDNWGYVDDSCWHRTPLCSLREANAQSVPKWGTLA